MRNLDEERPVLELRLCAGEIVQHADGSIYIVAEVKPNFVLLRPIALTRPGYREPLFKVIGKADP